jgi:hypothetical protein
VPLKRYNLLTAAIYPKLSALPQAVSSDGEISKNALKKISNLIEYAEKNPGRIPKIARRLERRLVKDINRENRRGYVDISVRGFIQLIVCCSKLLSLFTMHVFRVSHLLLHHR